MRIQLLLNNIKTRVVILFIILLILGISLGFRKSGDSVVVYHQSQWNEYAPEIDKLVKVGQVVKEEGAGLKHVHGGIASHHIPTTIPRLVEFYSRLKGIQSVRNFIIIGPDHTDAGRAPVTVSNANFFTIYGEIKPMHGLAEKLKDVKLANIEEAPFDLEHSIGSQMLIISKIFPDAKVTPIMLRSDTTKDHAKALGEMLVNVLDDETVLIASVDFSHYLATEQAMPVDQISGEVIRNLDFEAIPLIKADSNRSVEVFMRAMNMKGAIDTGDFEILNTNDPLQNSDYTTGYVFGYWGIK